jgi:hypothetical protein
MIAKDREFGVGVQRVGNGNKVENTYSITVMAGDKLSSFREKVSEDSKIVPRKQRLYVVSLLMYNENLLMVSLLLCDITKLFLRSNDDFMCVVVSMKGLTEAQMCRLGLARGDMLEMNVVASNDMKSIKMSLSGVNVGELDQLLVGGKDIKFAFDVSH